MDMCYFLTNSEGCMFYHHGFVSYEAACDLLSELRLYDDNGYYDDVFVDGILC